MFRSSISTIAAWTLSGVVFAQTDFSSAIRPAPPATFAGTYHVASGVFTPADQGALDPGLGTGNEIYNNTADSGFYYDDTGFIGTCDEGVIPDSGLIAGAQDDYILTSIEIAYYSVDVTVDIEIDLFDHYVACSDFILSAPVATIVAPGLPGGSVANMVILDLTGLGICLQGSDGAASGLGYAYRFPTHVGPTGPLLASDPNNCPPGDGTFYQNPVGGCDGAGAGSGLGDLDSVFIPGVGCAFFSGYPANPFASWHFAVESELSGGCCTVDEPSDVRLNEIYASHSGTDDMEFVELVGPPGASLDDHAVLIVEGEGGGAGTLDRVWDLSGLSIPASGYFVLGDTAVLPNDFGIGASNAIENGTETIYLVQACDAGALMALLGTNIDPDGDLVTDIPSLASIVDVVAMVDGDFGTTDFVYDGAQAVGPDGAFFPAGIFRGGDFPSGWCDSFLDFDVAANMNQPRTPGAMNVECPVPCTDDCACPTAIAGVGLFDFDTTNATMDGAGDPLCYDFGTSDIDHDVWFAWTPDETCDYTINACGLTSVDTKMALFDGADCATAEVLDCNDDTCSLQSEVFGSQLQAGQTYLIRVGTFPGASGGPGQISIASSNCAPICPDNDDCACAEAIAGTGVFDFDSSTAKQDGAGDPLCYDFGTSEIDSDVWYTWTAPCNGDYVVGTCNLTSVDTKIAIYDGSDCATSQVLDCNDDAAVGCGLQSQIFGDDLVAGESYLIRIGTFPGALGGTGQFSIEGPDVGGANYCVGGLNSDGQTGAMSISGSVSVAANDLVVVASALPDSSFAGQFVMGDTPDQLPFGNGFLCISLGGTFIRLNPIINGGGDMVSRTVDNTTAPSDVITPGSTWYFQYWYRDLPTVGTNFTDGICVCFVP